MNEKNCIKYLYIVSDKGLVPKIYEELLQLNNKDKHPNFKVGKGRDRHLPHRHPIPGQH